MNSKNRNPALMKMMNLDGLDQLSKTSLKNALTDLFKALTAEIHEVMETLDENKDDYHLCIHPFSIERVDGDPVPERLLRGIQAKLQSDQRL